MSEQEEKKTTKVQNAMWNFCKLALSWGTYIGVQVLLASALRAGVSGGVLTVGSALWFSVTFSAVIHMFIAIAAM